MGETKYRPVDDADEFAKQTNGHANGRSNGGPTKEEIEQDSLPGRPGGKYGPSNIDVPDLDVDGHGPAAEEEKMSACMRFYVKGVHLFPVTAMITLVAVLFYLLYVSRAYALAYVTIYIIHFTWCQLVHVSIFSLIGQVRIRHAEKVDWREEAFKRELTSSTRDNVIMDEEDGHGEAAGSVGTPWDEVVHFVFLPNYKEELGILREALDTIAQSSIAATQIGVCLAMEAREEGSDEKAKILQKEYNGKFKHLIASYHPAGIPGEMPGKSANTRWAAQICWVYLDEQGIDNDYVVFTVADADSDFHPSYFEALNCKWSALQKSVRDVTIFQAPIMHYKNYHTQPSIVRLCSLFVSQHELSNLADRSATCFPYSTYSLSCNLAKNVGGWDAEWISEDWHMFLKCFLQSGGVCTVHPIFLPIVNYTPEDTTWWGTIWARWVQGKRHALGIAEMVFYLSQLPVECMNRSFGEACYLILRGAPLMYKMLSIHIIMATYFVFATVNGPLVIWFILINPDEEDPLGMSREERDFWLKLNVGMGIITLPFFALMQYANVQLYESLKSRIVPLPDDHKCMKTMFDNGFLHLLVIIPLSIIATPFMTLAGGLCEWIAAVKTAKSHKFEYEVALKATSHLKN